MPCRFASSGTVATSRSASRAILALNVATNFLRDLVIFVLHRLRQSRTLHTLTFGPISGVHFTHALLRGIYGMQLGRVLAKACARRASTSFVCQIRSFGTSAMKHQRRFESSTASREAVKTRVLIADLDRIVQILNGDIAAEEEQAGIFDLFHPEYPMLARAIAARRDNLTDTIAALEQRLATIKEPKFELPSV